jgi:hypothetical protein
MKKLFITKSLCVLVGAAILSSFAFSCTDQTQRLPAQQFKGDRGPPWCNRDLCHPETG